MKTLLVSSVTYENQVQRQEADHEKQHHYG